MRGICLIRICTRKAEERRAISQMSVNVNFLPQQSNKTKMWMLQSRLNNNLQIYSTSLKTIISKIKMDEIVVSNRYFQKSIGENHAKGQ